MLGLVFLLLLLLISIFIIINFNKGNNKQTDIIKRLSSCQLYKSLIVPGGLDWSVEVIEDFKASNNDIDIITDEQLKLQINDANKNNLPIVWVYNPYEETGKFWLDFGSRRNRQVTSDLRRLCLTTILKNFPEFQYRIVVFNQDNLEALIPKYYRFCSPLGEYLKKELVKYVLLETYGGYWVPIDTVMVQSIDKTLNSYYNNKLIVNGFVSTQYKEMFSYNSDYIGCQKGHQIVREMVKYIVNNVNTFQNGIRFKDGVHKYFQVLCELHPNMVDKYNLVTFTNGKNHMLSYEDLYSKNNNMDSIDSLYIIPTLYNDAVKSHMYGYLERLSVEQLMESEMWLTYVISKVLK